MSKSIMVVGAGPGIGQAWSEVWQGGWTVILASRSSDRLTGLVAQLVSEGITAYGVVTDAADPRALRLAFDEAERISGGLTAVLYNAAVLRRQDLFSMSDDDVLRDLAINVAGGLHTIRNAVALFEGRGGTILVTGGGLGVTPNASFASLGVGKAGLRNITQALVEPLAAKGIRIAIATIATLVSPGSAESAAVAETFLAARERLHRAWEAVYPAA